MFYEKERGKRIWSRFKDWDKKEFSEEDTGKTKAKKKKNPPNLKDWNGFKISATTPPY